MIRKKCKNKLAEENSNYNTVLWLEFSSTNLFAMHLPVASFDITCFMNIIINTRTKKPTYKIPTTTPKLSTNVMTTMPQFFEQRMNLSIDKMANQHIVTQWIKCRRRKRR